MKLHDLLKEAEADYESEIKDQEDEVTDDDKHEMFHDIADRTIPVYNGEILEVAANNPELALEPSALCSDTSSPLDHIVANIYTAILEHLHKNF